MYKFSRKDLQIVKELIEIHSENDDHENAIEWAMDICGDHDDDSASTEAWFTRYNAITDEVCRRSRCRERWGSTGVPSPTAGDWEMTVILDPESFGPGYAQPFKI